MLTDDDLGAAEEGGDLEGLHEWQQEIIRKAIEVINTDDEQHSLKIGPFLENGPI